MRNGMSTSWKTTACGLLAGLSLAARAGLGLPEPWPKVMGLICAAALAALGYNATDCSKCPGNGLRIAAGATAMLLMVLACGCAVSGLALAVRSPTFGSVEATVGGSTIGNTYAGVAKDMWPPAMPLSTLPGTNLVALMTAVKTNAVA